MNNIRNFAIIAHIDHGKSTLADRFLEITGVVRAGKHEEQLLDRNPISRERGITIKLAPVRMIYRLNNSGLRITDDEFDAAIRNPQSDNQDYILNLIDTPGHVDFSYEVDRTLACVEGVILLVDSTQGIQAQTISNAYKALEKNLVIIPVLNKIDLPNAEVEKSKKQLQDFLGIREDEIFSVSAKTGENVEKLLATVIRRVPPPNPNLIIGGKLQSLIFDSYYDLHRGVIAFIRIFSGQVRQGLTVKLNSSGQKFEILEVGEFTPELVKAKELGNGEIGYIATNLKDIHQVRVGDAIVDQKTDKQIISGYKKVKPMVFASVFPTDTNDYLNLKKALEKLYLNDSSLEFTTVYSKALGTGFRVGFLGLLHADVVRERLEREFNLDLILTPPQVEFLKGATSQNRYLEPYVKIAILTPDRFLGPVMQLCENYRVQFETMDNKNQIMLKYIMPLSEMIADFYDNLKSVSSGYASVDWEFLEYREVEADKLSLLLNGNPVEEFSEIIVQQRAFEKANFLVKRLRELIPRQQYEVKIQAQYRGKIIASERISPFRKDVLIKSGKVIGAGDVGRKKKLLEKQKEGKKKLKMIGRVEIPKEAFLKLFKKN